MKMTGNQVFLPINLEIKIAENDPVIKLVCKCQVKMSENAKLKCRFSTRENVVNRQHRRQKFYCLLLHLTSINCVTDLPETVLINLYSLFRLLNNTKIKNTPTKRRIFSDL